MRELELHTQWVYGSLQQAITELEMRMIIMAEQIRRAFPDPIQFYQGKVLKDINGNLKIPARHLSTWVMAYWAQFGYEIIITNDETYITKRGDYDVITRNMGRYQPENRR
jgi:hypothetical protein